MTNLVAAYQANDILAFEKILRTNRCATCMMLSLSEGLRAICAMVYVEVMARY